MQRLLLKALSAFVALRYRHIPKAARYYLRDNIFCKLNQVRFYWLDYVAKSKYKVIDFRGEFGTELHLAIPFAYWHHLNGTLQKTISAKHSRELYFFSENHEECHAERLSQGPSDQYDLPNSMHSTWYTYNKWQQVPYAEHFKNDLFSFDKPTLVIANKYNVEWDQPPINFIDLVTLDKIITACKPHFQIVYNRPLSKHIVPDNSETCELGDIEWLRKHHPDVLLMSDLMEEYCPGVANNYNHLQLMVYANCRHFISVHGGTASLASYFGGVNIILSDPNHGLEYIFNDYATILPKLANTTILHAPDRKALLQHMYTHIAPERVLQPGVPVPARQFGTTRRLEAIPS